MKILNPFGFILVAVFLGFTHSTSAATVSWGALATSAIASCDPDPPGNCDVNSNADAAGGSSSANASTLINTDPRGTASANATLSGVSLTPTLSVLADSFSGPGIDSNLVQSTASGIQAYTNLDSFRTITMNLMLTTGQVADADPPGDSVNAVIAYGAVFKPGVPALTFDGDTLEDILLSPNLETAIGAPSVIATPLFSSPSATFEFDVGPGESFLIWAMLVAQAENGGIADASSTLHINLFEGTFELGPGQLEIASVIPLPAGVWLFLTGIGLIAGLARRYNPLPAC